MRWLCRRVDFPEASPYIRRDVDIPDQGSSRGSIRMGDDRAPVRTFRYPLDPLCIAACAAYGLNRWVLHGTGFFSSYFDDILLIPAALPWLLGVQRVLGIRRHNNLPTWLEIGGHWLVWSVVCEGIAPFFIGRATGDLADAAAYALGAVVAGFWWNGVRITGTQRKRGRIASVSDPA